MKLKMTASASLEFQKFDFEAEVEAEKADIFDIQQEFNRLAIQGLEDLVEKKRELAERLRR